MTSDLFNLDHASVHSNAENGQPRGGSARLNILWVKVGGLWPLNTGGRLRSFYLLKALSNHHNVTVITTHHPSEDPADLRKQLPACGHIHSLAHTPAKKNSARFLLALARSLLSPLPVDLYKNRIPGLRKTISRLLRTDKFDVCVADFLVAMPNLPRKLSVPVLFFEHNVEYMIWRRLEKVHTGLLTRALLSLEWRKMRRYELQACRSAGVTVAVSNDDKALLSRGAPDSHIVSIATGVDIDYFRPDTSNPELATEIVFTGSMDWHPNEDAMLYFISDIWPLIRRDYPQASMTMVGRNPSTRLKAAAVAAGIRITGTVADVRPFIAKAAVYVVPLRVGGGTRLKIYEALAMGKAVISTTIGAEGLPLAEGSHILRADDAASFARTTVELLRDRPTRDYMGKNGRQLMVQEYSWDRAARDFEGHIRELLDRDIQPATKSLLAQ